MGRTLLCSLGGALSGFILTAVVISITAGASSGRPGDAGPIIAIIGIFIAGMGAIAGAIVGGVADLREFFRRRDQASTRPKDREE